MSKTFIVVGAKGHGKTSVVKNILSQVHHERRFVYDINAEYGELYDAPLLEIEDFKKEALTRHNSVIVYEESTIFFSNRGDDKELKSTLVRARHQKNIVILVYHSLRSVPVYVVELANYLILKKTGDTPKRIESRFENDALNEAFKEINAHSDKYFGRVLTLLG